VCAGVPVPVLGPGHPAPKVVLLDGTGARAGDKTNGVGVNLAIGLTGRSGPDKRRRAHTHLLGLTVGEDWSMMGAQLESLPAPALVVVDGETAITILAQRLWPTAPIQRCWWHLPHGLRKAFYADDAHNRHNNPNWARNRKNELAELLREQIRHEHTVEQALADWDTFTAKIPTALTAAHAFLDAARPHAFTCLDPNLRKALACIGGPELATGVIERLMREINARTDIGGVRWTIAGLRDLLTVLTARILRHPTWTEIRKNIRPSNTIQFRLQKFNAT
jgi:transposase-like protein